MSPCVCVCISSHTHYFSIHALHTQHFSGWFITSTLVLTLSVILMTVTLTSGQILRSSNPIIVFVLLESFAIATISLSFAISTLFDKAKLAAACAGIIYFLLYLPFIYMDMNQDKMGYTVKMAASISSTTAFGLACSFLGELERLGSGLQWSNLRSAALSCDGFTFMDCLGMLWIDTIFYAVFTWYVEKIRPGEYGMRYPWYFPLMYSYWFPKARKGPSKNNAVSYGSNSSSSSSSSSNKYKRKDQTHSSGNVYDDDLDEPGNITTTGNPTIYEGDDERTPLISSATVAKAPDGDVYGIYVSDLTKVYEGSCFTGDFQALHSLSFEAKRNAITILLGHNGAGKSTTISILTGLYEATTGEAYVNGYSVNSQMDQVREALGICPQQNILWDGLTVYEHLLFAARVKGRTWEEAKSQATKFLDDIGLSDKKDSPAAVLSGGMKRKLSICLAFIGGSKVVILDEPTAGVDPRARRHIWAMLQEYKANTTILMTTHIMEEADILNDNVVIMSSGRDCCSGNSMDLKRRFKVNYSLVCIFQEGAAAAMGVRVWETIRQFVPGATQGPTRGQDVTFQLPYESKGAFMDLFSALEQSKSDLQLLSFGLTAPSLEDVFLIVTDRFERWSRDNASSEDLQDYLNNTVSRARPASGFVARRIQGANDENISDDVSFTNGGIGNGDDAITATTKSSSASAAATAAIGGGGANRPGKSRFLRNGKADNSNNNNNNNNNNDVDDDHDEDDDDEFANQNNDFNAATEKTMLLPPLSSASAGNINDAADAENGMELGYNGRFDSGLLLLLRRFGAMFLKRLRYAKRDLKAVFSQVLLPAVFVCIGLVVANSLPVDGNRPAMRLSPAVYDSYCGHDGVNVPFFNFDSTPADAAAYPSLNNVLVEAVSEFTGVNISQESRFRGNVVQYFLDTQQDLGPTRFGAITSQISPFAMNDLTVGTALFPEQRGVVRAWYDSQYLHSMPAFINMGNNAILKNTVGSGANIFAYNYPFPKVGLDCVL